MAAAIEFVDEGIPVCAVIGCAAPLVRRIGEIADAVEGAGWRPDVIVTPQATDWFPAPSAEPAQSAEPAPLAEPAGGWPVSRFRSPDQPRRLPRPSAAVIAPLTLNSANKIVAGIADSYALSTVAEILAIGGPLVAVPMVSARLAAHPRWATTVDVLISWGVTFIDATDGTAGPSEASFGDGETVAAKFDPQWIATAIGRPMVSG